MINLTYPDAVWRSLWSGAGCRRCCASGGAERWSRVSWAEGPGRSRAGSLLDVVQGWGMDGTGHARGEGVWVGGRKGLPSPSRRWLSGSSFDSGLGSFRTLPSGGAWWRRGCWRAQPCCLCLPGATSGSHLASLVVAFPSRSSTGFLLFWLPHCQDTSGCRVRVVLRLHKAQ